MFKIEFYDNQLHTNFSIYRDTLKSVEEEIKDLEKDTMSLYEEVNVVRKVPRYSNIHVWQKIK